jgi:hypothetical protein
MGKVAIVSCEPRHRAEVFALHAATFGGDAAQALERRYAWSRLANPAPGETGEWVAVADGARVVGYVAALPVPYRVDGQRCWAQTTADFMVAEGFTFHGLSLMKAAFQRFPRQVSLDDVKATQAVLTFMKATRVLSLGRWAKPLDARLLGTRTTWGRHVPPALLAPARHALRLVDRLRRPGGLPRAVPVPFDARFDRWAEAQCGVTGAAAYRDAAWYRWRYGPGSPQAGARAVGVLDARGELEGYAVVALRTDAEATGHVLELCAPRTAGPELLLALLSGAVRELRRLGAWGAVVHVTTPAPPGLGAVLEACGFSPRAYRTGLYVRPAPDDALPFASALLDGARWDFQFADAEVTHGLVT